MGTFRDLNTVVDAINDPAGAAVAFASKELGSHVDIGPSIGSISKYGSDSIYYFPIIASGSVSYNVMGMVAQSLEGAYMSFVRSCFAMVPAKKVKGDLLKVDEYIKLFHQNIGLQTRNDLVVSLREDTEEYSMFVNDILNEVSGKNIDAVLNESGRSSRPNGRMTFDRYAVSAGVSAQNAMRPSVIEVTVTFILDGNPIEVKIPVGIKTQLHPVDPMQLTDHIAAKTANGKGNLIYNLVRWKTGELKSLSDILFGIGDIKKTVAASSNSDMAKWISVLEKRRSLAKMRNSIPFLSKQPILPNTSILLSIEDVNEIERQAGWNMLKDIRTTTKLMDSLMLLGVVVTDEASEIMYVIYDGHTRFETIPFNTVERENKRNNDLVNALIKSALAK